MTSLGTLIQKFIDALTPIGNISTAVENIPDATVNVGFRVDPMPNINIPDVSVGVGFDVDEPPAIGTHGFQHGTHGQFLDFGSGTPAVLHGKERIQTLREVQEGGGGSEIGGDLMVLEKRLMSIERLLKDQPRAFGLAIADSMTLMN